QRMVADLKHQLQQKPKVEEKRIEVPVIPDAQMAELQALAAELNTQASEMMEKAQQLLAFGQDILALIARTQQPASLPHIVQRIASPNAPAVQPPPSDSNVDQLTRPLRPGEMKILMTMVQRYPMKLTRIQIATMAGFTAAGGTYGSYFGYLKKRGLI